MNMARAQSGTVRRKTHQRGTSMIEVLVALFILAVGMLGTSSLQLSSKRSNMEAKDRTIATMVAQGFVERMRMNPRQLATYTDAGAGRALDGTVFAAVDCSVECTDIEMANLDLYDFEQSLAGAAEQIGGTSVGGISEPLACIDGPDGGSATYTVAIAWRGLTRLSDPTIHTCGQGSGVYDSADGTQADVHRRVLVIDTFITVPL
jgi:type IV pilus assembly protein PilV